MTSRWPLVPLGELLTAVSRPLAVVQSDSYALLGAHWYAKGLYIKDRKMGRDIQAKTLYEVRRGDFVYNRLFAWMGSFALADDAVNSCFVSNEFRSFLCDVNRLHPQFLYFYFARRSVWSEVEGLSTGSTPTSRNRLKDERFLAMKIPLPPIQEQERVVSRLRQIQTACASAALDRNESLRRAAAVPAAFFNNDLDGYPRVPLRELLELRAPDVGVDSGTTYHFAGVYSFGRGLFTGPVKNGSEISYKKLTRLREGEFTYPKLMAWEGAFGTVGAEQDELVVSTEYPVFAMDRSRLLPATIGVYFAQPEVWETVAGGSHGTNVRRRRLHPDTFLAHAIPLPPIARQERLQQLVELTDGLKVQQRASADAMAALLPSTLDKAFSSAV